MMVPCRAHTEYILYILLSIMRFVNSYLGKISNLKSLCFLVFLVSDARLNHQIEYHA